MGYIDNIARRIANKNKKKVKSLQLDNAKYKIKRVNALDYGFKNDGSDNTLIMNHWLANDANNILYFENGVYGFSEPIKAWGNMMWELDPHAEVRAIADVGNSFITFNETYLTHGYSIGSYIRGGTLNGNMNCQDLLGLSMHRHHKLFDIRLRNFKRVGLDVRYTGNTGGEMSVDTLWIQNDSYQPGSIGMKTSQDNRFNKIIIQDIETCLIAGGSQHSQIHGWNLLPEVIPNSLFAKVVNNNAIFNHIQVDTIRYGFKNDNVPYYCRINGIDVLFNMNIYTKQRGIDYPPVIFGNQGQDRWQVTDLQVAAPFSLTVSEATEFNTLSSNFYNPHVDKQTDLYPNADDIVITNLWSRTSALEFKRSPSKISSDVNNAYESGCYTITPSWLNSPLHGGDSNAGYGTLDVSQSLDWSIQVIKPKHSRYIYSRSGSKALGWGAWTVSGVGAGTSTARPIAPLLIGQEYADTTLNKLIMWFGSSWKDGSGVDVWSPNKAYALNAIVNTDANQYQCTVAGTTVNANTPPTHTTGTATDGTVTWTFVKAIR